jgi:hypothetical protein
MNISMEMENSILGPFRWEYSSTESKAMDENGQKIAIDDIVELIDQMDYSSLKR